MIVQTFNRSILYDHQTERQFYIRDVNLKLHIYSGQLNVMDLNNALKTGKDCISYSINWRDCNNSIIAWNILDIFKYNVKSLFTFLEGFTFDLNKWRGLNEIHFQILEDTEVTIYKSLDKSIRTFSPFSLAEMKPLTQAPAKWSVRHAIRAIINKQYEYLRCKGVYTDDFAHDAACNYQQGEITNNLSFAERLIESPSGWWASGYNGVVSICCHSFDSNEFKFKLN